MIENDVQKISEKIRNFPKFFWTSFSIIEKKNIFLELEKFSDIYFDSEFHALSIGDEFRAIRALLPGFWSPRKNFFFSRRVLHAFANPSSTWWNLLMLEQPLNLRFGNLCFMNSLL